MALNRLRGLPYFEQKPFIQQAAVLASKIKPLNDRNQEEQQDDSNTLARVPVETQQAMIPALLDQTTKSDNDEVQEKLNKVNNAYLDKLLQDENLTKTLTGNDLKTLNETFANNDEVQEKLNKVNNAYFEALPKQIQKAENEGRKITDVLSTYDLRYLNRLYEQENKPESFNALNITYLKTLLAQNIEDVCDEDDLLNIL